MTDEWSREESAKLAAFIKASQQRLAASPEDRRDVLEHAKQRLASNPPPHGVVVLNHMIAMALHADGEKEEAINHAFVAMFAVDRAALGVFTTYDLMLRWVIIIDFQFDLGRFDDVQQSCRNAYTVFETADAHLSTDQAAAVIAKKITLFGKIALRRADAYMQVHHDELAFETLDSATNKLALFGHSRTREYAHLRNSMATYHEMRSQNTEALRAYLEAANLFELIAGSQDDEDYKVACANAEILREQMIQKM